MNQIEQAIEIVDPEENIMSQIAAVILSKKIFDLDEDSDGAKTIHQLIAREILKGYSFFDMVDRLEATVQSVRRNLESAITYLRSLGVPVYKAKKPGGKEIRILTIIDDYRDAKNKDFDRALTHVSNHLDATYRDNMLKHPELKNENASLKRLSNKLKQQQLLIVFKEED